MTNTLQGQADAAHKFYDNDILYLNAPSDSRNKKEIELIGQFLKGKNNTLSTFHFIGAGYGRLINELLTQYSPQRTIAVEIVEQYAQKIRQTTYPLPVEVHTISYFDFSYKSFYSGHATIFLNWSIVADFGSWEAIVYMFEAFKKTSSNVCIIGDMPEQTTYLDQIENYYSSHEGVTFGTFVMNHHANHGSFTSFLPKKSELIDKLQELGYITETLSYLDDSGNSRYMFRFEWTE